MGAGKEGKKQEGLVGGANIGALAPGGGMEDGSRGGGGGLDWIHTTGLGLSCGFASHAGMERAGWNPALLRGR